MDYIKDDIVVVNEDGAEVKLFPSTVDEQVYVQDGINGPTTLDVELELLRNKKHELSLLDYSIKRETFIENPNPQVNSSSFNPQTSVNYTIELGCVHDGSIYGFALWDWTITENDTSFEINIINQQTNEVSRTLLTGRNAYSVLGISFEDYSLTTNAKGQYADQGFYIFIALGDKVTSDQHILAVLLLNLDTLKATMIGSSVYSGHNITNVVYSEENSGFYVFTKKADSEDVYVSFFNVIEKSFENVESKLLFETNTASEYYLYLYNTPSIQLLKDMNRKGNNGIFVMGSNAGRTIKTDRLLVFSIDRSNKNNPSINFLSEAYTLDTTHDEPYSNYAGNPIIYCERQTSTIYYLRPYYVPGKMYDTAGCFHRVTFDLERKMFVNEQNLENVISGLKSSMDDYCFIDCVMTCEGDSIYIIGGTQHKLVKVGTSLATRTRPQRLAVKINALLSNGFQEIEHSEEVINPFVTVKNILEVTPVNKGFQIYDESQNKPMWWNGESWETYPTASSEPSNPSEPDNSFETDWGTLGASELFKEDLSAPTFDIGDWTTTTLNGEPVIKSKKITSSQSTELTVTLTNITSLTVGLRASSESNYDKFYFHLNDEQMFYLTGDGTTKQETYADLDSSQSYKLKFVYTKDSSIDKFDDCGYITKIEYTQPSTSNEENNPIEVQMVRGYDSSIQGYTGKDGQLVYNQTTKRLHTMNGATRGGYPLALLSDVPTIPSTYDATKITLSSSNFTSSHVKGALDELFQSVDNGKTLIASAITDKGVETSKTDTFEVMAENIENIQTFDPDASDFYPGGNDFTFKSRTDKAAIQELYSTNEDRVFDSFNYKYNGGTTQNISLTYPLIAMNGVYNSYEWPNLYHERIGTITESKYIVNQMKITDLYNRTWESDRKYMLVSDSENGDVYCITYNQIYSATSKSGNKGYTTISRVNKDDFTLEKIGERPGCRTKGSQSFFKVGVYDHKIFFIDGYEMQWAKHPDNPTSGIGEYHNILAFDLIERCWVNYGELPTACYNPRVFAYDGWLYLLNYANKSTSYKIYNENVFSCRINLKTKAMESLDNFVTSTDSFSSSKISLSNVIHLGDQYYLMYLLDVGVAVLDAKTYTYQTSSSDNPYNGWTLGGVSRTYGSLLAFTYSRTWFTKGDYCYVGGYKFQIDKESKTFNVIAHNDAIDPLTFFHVTRNNKNYIYWMDPQWTYMARCEDEDFGNVEWLVEEDGFHPSSVYLVATEAGGESNYIAVHQAVYIVPEDVYDDYYDREFYKGTFVKSYVNVQLYDLNNHKPVNIINGDASIMDNYLWLEKDINGKNIITLKYTLRLHKDRIYFFFYSTSVTSTNHNRTVIYDIKTQKWSVHPYTFPMSGKTTQIIRDIFSNFQRWNDQLIACSYAYNIYVMENETGQWTDTGILLPNDGAKDPLGVYKDKLFYQYNGMRDTYIGYIDLNTGEFNNTWVKTACNRDYTSNYADGRYIYIMNGRGTGFQNTGIGWGELNFGEILDCETGEMKLFHPSSASLEGRGLIVKNKNTIYHILPGNGPASSSSYGTTTSWVDTYHLTEDGQTNPTSTWRYSPSIKPTGNLFVLYSTVAPRLAMGDNKVFLFKGQFRNLIDSVEDNNKVTYSKKAMVSYDVDTMEFKRYADITGADDLNIDSILLYSTGKNVYYEGYIYFISSHPSYAIYRIDVSTSVLTKVHEPTAFTPPVLLGINNNKIYYYRASSAGIAYYDLSTQTETLKAISTYIFSNDSNQKYYVSMSNTHIYVNKVTTASNSETPLLTTVVYDLATWNTRKVTDVKIERGTVITEIYDENFFVVNNDIYVGVYRSPLIPTEMKHPEIYSGRDANIVYIYRFDTTTFAWSIVSYVPYVLASEFFSDGKRIFAVGSHSDSKSVACSMITELTLQTKSYFSVLPNGGNTITLTNALPDIPVNVGKGRLQCIDDPAIELYIK